jgi:hypothetical protein
MNGDAIAAPAEEKTTPAQIEEKAIDRRSPVSTVGKVPAARRRGYSLRS